ncbi:alpha/beta-hydrolase, partial [Metschnikowia bicuspidata var. bicuspidata NRRL YB-4993]
KAALFPVQAAYTDPATGVCFNTYYAPAGSPAAPLYVCHHGAGSSAMTFWCLARQLRDLAEGDDVPGVFAFDARGHGGTCPPGLRYTLADLAGDFAFVMREFCERHRPGNPVCLVGHSLGGAVLTEFVARFPDLDCNVRGLVVVDVVEDTAVRSLLQMAVFLHKRPRAFGSYGQAIRWHLQTRLLRNEESARVSVPELLVRGPGGGLVWKASLLDMAPSWHTWFDGLSRKFLACRLTKQSLAKMLVLSSSETLDKGLTIGQMQGRFQLVVFNNSTNAGHFLHEDIPRQVAATLSEFMRR